MEIFNNSNKEIVKEKAQEQLNLLLKGKNSKPILFLSSGGSSLELLHHYDFFLDRNITITVLDERIDKNPDISNFTQLTKTDFYRKAILKPNCRFIDTRLQEGDSIEQTANRFESKLRKWKAKNREGIIIATLGIGEDGHIAGIPVIKDERIFDKYFNNTEKWTQSYNATELGWNNPYKNRVTTTLPFLLEIDFGIVYIVGEGKRAALTNSLNPNISLFEVPAGVINLMQNISIFTDIKIS